MRKKTLVFKTMTTYLLIPCCIFSRELDLIERKCGGHEAAFNNVGTKMDEDELEGTEINTEDYGQEPIETDHLSEEFKSLQTNTNQFEKTISMDANHLTTCHTKRLKWMRILNQYSNFMSALHLYI